MLKTDTIALHNSYKVATDIYDTDAPYLLPDDSNNDLIEAYLKIILNDKSSKEKLIKLVEENPGVPQFKNLLSLYYSMHGNKQQANEINNELLQQFPQYLYAKVNAAKSCIEDDKPEKALYFLGESLSLSALYPERRVYHFDEYIHFYSTAIRYYCKTNNTDKAKEILQDLRNLKSELALNKDFSEEENLILISRINKVDSTIEEASVKEERSEPTLPQTTEPPVFQLKETEALYKHGFLSMPDEFIESLLKSDKAQLQHDLETVIYDAIKRFRFFEKKDLSTNESAFCLHAVFLLKEINATESLPVVLQLLRQPEELLNFWLFDLLTENFWQVLYVLGLHQTNKLTSFLKEPLNNSSARSEVSIVLAQIALHRPSRRSEIINAYKEVLEYFHAQKEEATIIDKTFIGMMVGDILDIGGTALYPQIKKLYEDGIVDEVINGTWENIERLPEAGLIDKRPIQGYFTIKEDIAAWELSSDDDMEDDWELAENEVTGDDIFFEHPSIAVDIPKIKADEICYCGSGKRFENCHGKL